MRTNKDIDTVAKEITRITDSKKCAVILDFVGYNPTLALGAKTVGLGGDWTVVGLGGGQLNWHSANQAWGTSLHTPFYGSHIVILTN